MAGFFNTLPSVIDQGMIWGIMAIGVFITFRILNFADLTVDGSFATGGCVFAILVGVLFSTLTIFVDWRIIGMAFGITAGIFFIMGGIAFISKGNMAPLGLMALGLFIGAGLLALINWIIRSETIYWIVSFAIFAAVMFVAMFDIWNIKKITERGAADKNISYYCAFVMYTDFINVFIRILYFLIIIFGNKK